MRSTIVLVLLLTFASGLPSFPQQKADQTTSAVASEVYQLSPLQPPGDRVRCQLPLDAAGMDAALRTTVRLPDDYRIDVGDVVTVQVRGKVDLKYGRDIEVTDKTQTTEQPDSYKVMPDGRIHLPLIGSIVAEDKTVTELQDVIRQKLSSYFKHFTVDVNVASVGLIKVWVGGQVANPGPQVLPSNSTALEALLRADILPTGSTRLVRLTRGANEKIIDVYRIVALGEIDGNLTLQTGDQLYVPAVSKWVMTEGEVCRTGKFEMVSTGRSPDDCSVKDLIDLCQGCLPTAALSNAVIQRLSADGQVEAFHINLADTADVSNFKLKPGDKLIVPSVSDYQPTVRLVGEFKGEGVYQRVSGAVLNKTGVYKLAKGETAGDVITRTGGTTPQADFKRAKIERWKDGKLVSIPLDLEKLISRQDKSADIVLESGDTIVLPALIDKVYVFGQVIRPGGFAYEPDRRLVEYLAYAGGPGTRARSSVVIVRGSTDKPEVMKLNLTNSMSGQDKDNPVMQPGDIVYVPEGIVNDWRDVSQIISTVRLLTLLF